MASEAPANTTLLSQSLEAFQSITIGPRTIVVTVVDDLPIGHGTSFGADYDQIRLFLYAESLTLSGLFTLKSGVISTQLINQTADGVISTAGAKGADAVGANQNPEQPGENGGPGAPGGDLGVYLGTATGEGPDFAIDAGGGDGGAGQTGLLVAPGGTGGDGGDGGSVIFLGGVMADGWIESLTSAAALTTVAAQQSAINSLLAGAPAGSALTDQWAAAINALASAAAPGASEQDVMVGIESAALILQQISRQYGANVEIAVNVDGGRYGVYGEGQPSGKDGVQGAAGSLTIQLFGTPADLATLTFSPFFLIHPSQCARLLNQIELMYLVVDPVGNPQGVGDIITLLTRLQARTELFVKAAADSPLITYYNNNEQDYGSVGSVQQLVALNGQAGALLSQLNSGQDLFGYDSSAAPLGSFAFYNTLLNQLIANFSILETAYNAYFNALASNTATTQQITAACAQQQQIIETANAQIAELSELAVKTATIIDSYQTILPPLKQALEDQLEALSDDIKSHFDFNFDTFLQAMTSLAFAPESKFMMLIQGTSLLYDGMSKVTNVQGVPVNKDYIISQVNAVESSVDSINEGFEQLQNGALKPDDPGAGKLIAEENAFLSFMSQFEDTFPEDVDACVDAFNAYVAAITARNNQILTYNSSLLLIARGQAAIADAEARNKTLDQQTLSTLSPELPDLVSYVSGIYYQARNQVLQTLDQTSQAYRFWALSDRDLMAEAFGSTPPPEIDTAVLTGAQNLILGACQQAIEGFGTQASVFPSSPDGVGIVFELSASDLVNFKMLKEIMFKPKTVMQQTTRATSPFAGMANVRVSEVRVWIDGAATSDGRLEVNITQTGQEQITSTSGKVFSFTHEPVSKLFIYDLTTGEIVQKANFGVSQGSGSTAQIYAAIGPFAAWQIQVKPGNNSDLSLAGVTGVRIEFHGTSYAF